MKLKKLDVRDYRGIGSLEMFFNHDMTVILGRNGVGKSTILDAISSILVAFQRAWPSADRSAGVTNLFIPAIERRLGRAEASISLTMAPDRPGAYPDIKLTSSYRGPDTSSMPRDFMDFWNFTSKGGLKNEVRPLMVYYRQDRGFEREESRFGDGDFLDILSNSLEGDLKAISHLQRWWDKLDAQEARHVRDHYTEFRDPQLEAIRKLIKEIDGFTGVYYSSTQNPEGLYFEKEDGVSVHVDMLSSGERSFIILLADLARRLQVLNPRADLDEIPGIVLIDEIELNLHPAWQSKIISTLRRVFAGCQFVITTHSPQVVSSIESDHVVIMEPAGNGYIKLSKPIRTKGQTSNYLLEGVFGSSERFPEIDSMIERFNYAIDHNNILEAESLYSNIIESIEGSPPELLVLKKRLSKIRGDR